MSLPVGYSDLVLGRTVTIEHIDGAPLDIKIPKNSNSGDTIEINAEVFLLCEENIEEM